MSWLLPVNTYAALISGIFMIGLGIFVFLKNPRKKLNIIYLFFTASMANWLIVSSMLFKAKTDAQAVFWDRMVYLGVVFIPIFMYHFGLIFIGKEKQNKWKLYLGYFLAVVFLILSRTDYFISGLYKYSWGVHAQAKILHHFFMAFFFFYVLLFLFEIYKYFKEVNTKDPIQAKQVRYLFIAFIILNIGAYAFLAAYNIDLNPLGAYFLEIISVSLTAFAVTKYHLFDTKSILTEILVAVMALILAALPFFMPSVILRVIAIGVFIIYCFLGYLLIRFTIKEVKAKESFEGQVKQRTQELSERNEELEKFYKLTIGRELKMAELKSKIKEIEEEKK
ncbi:MAG: histidine kinase N-terminal 7TM domain-containing protein [Candidatus Paceibacterota bacterium]|jgi:hypothetical protein